MEEVYLSVETEEWIGLQPKIDFTKEIALLKNLIEDFEGLSERQDYYAMINEDASMVSYYRGKEDGYNEAAKYLQKVVDSLSLKGI